MFRGWHRTDIFSRNVLRVLFVRACCDVCGFFFLLSKLTAELDAIPGEMEALDGQIARAEHSAAERLLARLGSDLEVGL